MVRNFGFGLFVILSLNGLCANAFFFAKTESGGKSSNIAIRGVVASMQEKYGGESFSCDDGTRVLSALDVNNQYCDCIDGTDEPGTSACSGGSFACVNMGYRVIKIPSSRVDDGVCDCCDGTDESESYQCGNTCATVAMKEKSMLEELTHAYQSGSTIRQQYIEKMTRDFNTNAESHSNLVLEVERQESVLHQLQAVEENEQRIIEEEAAKRQTASLSLAKDISGINSLPNHEVPLLLTALFDSLSMDVAAVEAALHHTPKSSEPHTPDDSSSDVSYDDEESSHLAGDEHGDEDSYGTSELGANVDVDVDVDGGSHSEGRAIASDHPQDAVDNLKVESCSLLVPRPSELLVPLCKTFSEETLYSDAKDFALDLILNKEAYLEIQLINGYYKMSGSLFDVQSFINIHKSEYGTDHAVCPPSFSGESSASDICGVGAALSRLQPDATGRGTMQVSPARAERMKVEDNVRDLDRRRDEVKRRVDDVHKHEGRLEFLALKDECFEVVDGKFTYKVCMLGSVTQQEEGGGRAVTLGSFESIKDSDSNSDIIMRFSRGEHCHAFGARSADVSISCGAENKLLSANEPSTCFYAFKMVSPVACTPKFADFHGLHI